jgi:hypothetical protein
MVLSPEYESGNTVKSLLGQERLTWDSTKVQGAFYGLPVYSPDEPSRSLFNSPRLGVDGGAPTPTTTMAAPMTAPAEVAVYTSGLGATTPTPRYKIQQRDVSHEYVAGWGCICVFFFLYCV